MEDYADDEAGYLADDDGTCDRCWGAGGYHDCGEDTCCCADPEAVDEDWLTCEDCGGTGYKYPDPQE